MVERRFIETSCSIGNVFLYNTLTGLRFSEALLSIKLIQTEFEHYANREFEILENFRYPEFIRKKTMKSYLTVYEDTILEIARNAKIVTPGIRSGSNNTNRLSSGWCCRCSSYKVLSFYLCYIS